VPCFSDAKPAARVQKKIGFETVSAETPLRRVGHKTALRGRKIKIYVEKHGFTGEWSNPVRSAERGVRNGKLKNGLCLLVNIEVFAAQNECGCAGPEAGVPVQKKGVLGSLQKKNFSTPSKTWFFCSF